jgi:hypothetical protein
MKHDKFFQKGAVDDVLDVFDPIVIVKFSAD